MKLADLPQRVDRLAGFDSLLSAFVPGPAIAQIEGLAGPAKSLLLARVIQQRGGQTLAITFQSEQAQRLLDDLAQFGIPQDRLFHLPALDSRWLADDIGDHAALAARIAALTALGSGRPCVLVGP